MVFAPPNLSSLYSSLGDVVTVHGDSTPRRGLFYEAGQDIFAGALVASEPTLRFPVGSYPSMTRGQVVVVSGRTWRLRTSPRLLLDGAEAIVELELDQ